MPQANRRINTSVFQAFGTDRVDIRVGEQQFSVSQLEAMNLMRRLCHHFSVQPPENSVVRVIDQATQEERRERLQEMAADTDISYPSQVALLIEAAKREGAVVDLDEYGHQRVYWPVNTPRVAGKSVAEASK